MQKITLNKFTVLAFTLLVVLLSGCKSAGTPKTQATNVRDKPPVKAVAAIEPPQSAAIGTQLGGARQGVTLNLRKVVSTIAGKVGLAGNRNGSETEAEFDSPKGITTDGSSLFLADSNNHTIRKIDIATGMVSTFAGMEGKKGNHDGKGSAARFNRPFGITTDGNNLYVTDSNNHTIREIDIDTGMVKTIAGSAGEVGYVDGKGKRAKFFIPEGVTVYGNDLYVSDTHNHSVRKVSLKNHAVVTIAGLSGAPGFFDDTGTKARFAYPKGITTDGRYLYVADFGNNQIRKITLKGSVVSTLSGTTTHEENGVEQTEVARFNYPSGITTDGYYLFVADTFNRAIRRIVIKTGVVSTIAGAEEKEGSVDGIGAEAHFKDPVGITTDANSLFVTDSSDHVVRKIR